MIAEGINVKNIRNLFRLWVLAVSLVKKQPIDVSNVALFNPATGKADRVGFRFEDGNKVRFFKSSGELLSNWSLTMAKLHDTYRQTVVQELMKQFGYNSVMQVPRIEKITLNAMGVGEAF